MPQEVFFGDDFAFDINGITHNLRTVQFVITSNSVDIAPLDTKPKRKIRSHSCRITASGYQSTTAGGGDFATLATDQLAETAPSAMSWTDTAGTPVSQLPATFFTEFPLSGMRIVNTTGGPGTFMDPTMWSVEIECDHI
jgi:hypothetical protein